MLMSPSQIHVRMVRESETAIYSAFWINVAETLMGRGRYIEALEMLQAVYSVLPDPAVRFAEQARYSRHTYSYQLPILSLLQPTRQIPRRSTSIIKAETHSTTA
jgi:hypothetical protein